MLEYSLDFFAFSLYFINRLVSGGRETHHTRADIDDDEHRVRAESLKQSTDLRVFNKIATIKETLGGGRGV
jgi:hypothetical protein